MSNRINKQRKTSFEQSLVCKIHLLHSLSSDPSEMPSCNYYIRFGFLLYKISPLDFSRCIECVQKNCSGCNILNISFKQFLIISTQHFYTEAELEEVEEYIVRLRK